MHLATHGHGKDEDPRFKEGALEFADPRVKTWPHPSPTPDVHMNRSNFSVARSDSCPEELALEESASSSRPNLHPLHEHEHVEQEQELEPAFQLAGRRGISGPRRRRVDKRHLIAEEIVKDFEWRMLLVVLSVCETARGEVKSEGTLNLARALLISGVSSTVVSQWKVDDASAPVLMAGLYGRMVAGMDVASELRASMVSMIHDGYLVHQWAPFVVMGLGNVTLPDQFLTT